MERCAALVVPSLLALVPAAAAAQTRKLNAPLAVGPAGEIADSRVTPDGASVVFLADLRVDGFPELWLAPLDGGAPARRLSADTGAVSWFELAPDGTRAAFLAEDDGVTELWSATLGPELAPERLNGELVPSADVTVARVTGDSSRVVYAAHQQDHVASAVYSAPLDGSGAPTRLSAGSSAAGAPQLVPGEPRVVFVQNGNVLVVPDDGSGAPVQLSFPSDGIEASTLRVGGAGYAAVVAMDGDFDVAIKGLSLDGGGLTAALSASVSFEDYVQLGIGFELAPDGAHLVYVSPSTSDLWAVPVDGSWSRVRANPLPSDVDPADVAFTSDGARVLFRTTTSLFYGALLGPGLVAAQIGGNNVTSFRSSPDATSVAYVAAQQVAGKHDLWHAPLDGSAPAVKLNGAMLATRDVQDGVSFAPGGRVVFRSDKELDERVDLWVVPADASSAPLEINGEFPAERDVQSFVVGAAHAAFVADLEEDEAFGLFGAPLDASLAPVALSESALQTVGDVGPWALSPDGRYAVYAAQHEPSGAHGLGSATLRRAAPAAVIDVGEPVASGPLVTPDSARVVFRTQPSEGKPLLHSAPIDLSAPALQLNGPLVGNGNGVTAFRVTADSARVVYSSNEVAANWTELWSVPVDGSGPRVQLAPQVSSSSYRFEVGATGLVVHTWANEIHAVPVEGGAALPLASLPSATALGNAGQDLELSPDGQWAVFPADRDAAGRFELYAARTDGTTGAIELSAPFANALGKVRSLEVSPDSSRVVYVADGETANRYDLYAAPIDGSSAAVRLSPAATFTAFVNPDAFRIAPDSARVVFLHGREFYRAPLDGSAPATLVSDPLPSGLSASGGEISSDGAWFVFRVRQGSDLGGEDVAGELRSVPLLGGATRTLSLPLPSGGSVVSHVLSPDGTRVVYRADQLVDGRFELFGAPIDGSRPARRESSPLALRGDAGKRYAFSPDGQALVYGADQERDGVDELFLRHQGRLATRRP